MKNKHYELELPEGYEEIYTIDAKDKKTAIIMNLVAFLILLPFVAIGIIAYLSGMSIEAFSDYKQLMALTIKLSVFALSTFAYMVLHELVHGIAYKIMTRQKLKFGLTLSVAYCGVPDIYCYRTCSIIALIMPTIVFLPVFIIPLFFVKDAIVCFLIFLLLGLHVSGCCMDIFTTLLFIFRFKNPKILMRDFGPKQIFYAPKD